MVTLFGHPMRSEVLLLCVGEVVLCFAVFLVIFGAGVPEAGEVAPWEILSAGALAASVGVASGATGLYRPDTWLRLQRVVAGTLLGGIALLAVLQLAVHAGLPTEVVRASWRWSAAIFASFVVVVLVTRLALVAYARTGRLRRRVAVLHAPDATWGAEHWISTDPYLDVVLATPAQKDTVAGLTSPRLRELGVWAVVAEDSAALPTDRVAELRGAGIRVFGEAEFLEHRLGRIDLARLPADWRPSRSPKSNLLVQAVRRSFDIAVSGVLILVTLPVLLLTAIAIKVDSRGPIFYRQERVGRHGRVYSLMKFRSMRTDAEAGGAPQWATKGDPRVTRVGRFIRLTRIDEIPQVLNVLRGDMAFIGPRPERPAFVKQLSELIPHYDVRACVKPGITGWAQVNYPYGASVADARMKLSYDLYYVERRSLFLDLLILIATVRVVLFQEGSR
ncbi:exopolysaccharide biosynthesis polyprenyl glycosylphosphotransferase [Roseomonas sp. CCTCC AB2023176]|uniref:exopolysaccharide biosynthesis polyprenyl glycosylphosphotransferase n=1 Tax=Roseomonas sp. CCTCC AB2023176 TaxID=3342640 RepID=UPI0035DE4BE7